MHMLTETQEKAMRALLTMRNECGRADEIAYVMGYRPCTNGRLAVTSALRQLLRPGKDVGELVSRLPPKDQWGSAMWYLTDAGRRTIDPPKPPETGETTMSDGIRDFLACEMRDSHD